MDGDGAPCLSNRGERILHMRNILGDGFVRCSSNLYHKDTNPDGASDRLSSKIWNDEAKIKLPENLARVINLGVAENRMVHDLMKDKFNKYNVEWEDYMYTYNDLQGILEARQAVAAFLTDRAKPPKALDPKQIFIMNGGGVCMEALNLALCDPGDAVMVASPHYGGIHNDAVLRPEAKVIQVHFHSKLESGQKEPFQVVASKFESVYQEETRKGVKIRAVYFMNPNNPLGFVPSKQEVLDMVNVCHRHSLHLIMNEVYMNSIFKEGVRHCSVLSLDSDEIPDPQRVHFVWAASKDLSMSGMRFGVIYTLNNRIIECLKNFAYFQSIPVYIQKVMALLLSDTAWLNNVYFPTNKKRLREAHKVTTDMLDEIEVPYVDQPSGLYVYADFRKFVPTGTEEDEMTLCNRFMDNGIYIAPSQAFYSNEQGWFRIIFSGPSDEIKLGMERIVKTCQALLEENKKLESVALN